MDRRGFTMIEILAALAILGLALMILLDAHYSALRLHADVSNEVAVRTLLERTVAQAEVGVLTGETSGSGDFGNRHPGYSWAYDAVMQGDDPEMELYQVTAAVYGPADESSITFWVYNPGVPSGGGGGGMISGAGQRGARPPAGRR